MDSSLNYNVLVEVFETLNFEVGAVIIRSLYCTGYKNPLNCS